MPGLQLAQAQGISVRTLYRDIATLKEQGARIEGEPGLGYVLRPGFMLAPLMFGEEEIEALVLGSRWVVDRGDQRLSEAAKNALAKIASVLPAELRYSLEANALLVAPASDATVDTADVSQIRQAIRTGYKLSVSYCDAKGHASERIIWPFALGYYDHMRILAGWCELRQEFRHFRTDRILALHIEPQRYPRQQQALLKEWRAMLGIALQ